MNGQIPDDVTRPEQRIATDRIRRRIGNPEPVRVPEEGFCRNLRQQVERDKVEGSEPGTLSWKIKIGLRIGPFGEKLV